MSKPKNLNAGFSPRLLLIFFFSPRAYENARQAVISFVASGVENHVTVVVGLAHFDHHGPGPSPGLRILKRDFTAQVVRINSCEALRHLVRIRIRSAEALGEIGSLDNQSVSFPVA